MDRCPLTNCFRCLMEKKEGFEIYEDCNLAGVFTCRCPGDVTVNLSKILKTKGAEVIHFCTCAFAKKTDEGWVAKDGGFCENIDKIIEHVHKETGTQCVKDYTIKTWGQVYSSQ